MARSSITAKTHTLQSGKMRFDSAGRSDALPEKSRVLEDFTPGANGDAASNHGEEVCCGFGLKWVDNLELD
jgi:hypothetical protein